MSAPRPLAPAIDLSVQLPATLSKLGDPHSELGSVIRAGVQQNVASLLARFGIPGTLNVTLTANGPEAGGRVFRLLVSGQPIRYPDELLRHVWCYINRQLPDPQVTPAFIHAWLNEGAGDAADASKRLRIADFLSLICAKIVECEPSILLGLAQCRAYASALGDGALAEPEWLLGILRQLLDMHISISDRRLVAEVLAGTPRQDDAAVIENLVTALRRDSIDIRIDKPTLRQLTTTWPTNGPTMFPFLREGLFEELGVAMPRYRFVVVDDLHPGSFAFRVNDFVSVPQFGLQPGRLMVNDTAERLRTAGFAGAVPIANPATGQPNGMIDASSDQVAQAQGLTTWNQIGYLILSFAEFLRRRACCTVHRTAVQRQMRNLGTVYPALVEATRSRHTDDEVTALVRTLVRDRVSMQNFRAILESLLDLDLFRDMEADASSATARPTALAHVRTALGPAIAHKAARGTDTIVVYLVDREIERLTAKPAAHLEQHGESILDALRRELAYLPPTAQVPCVLTSMDSREALQRLIATEHPAISVIAHEELPPGKNVQPIARVGL